MTPDCHQVGATAAELMAGRSRLTFPFLRRIVRVMAVALAAAAGDAAVARIGRLPGLGPGAVGRCRLRRVLPTASRSAVRTVGGWCLLAARHCQRSCW